jgi:Holliday junction resolvase RusA-like endonuclease
VRSLNRPDVTFSITVTPVGKPRMTQRDRWKRRPVVVRYWQYCDDLRAALPFYDLPERLSVTFYIPMPPSWSQQKRREHVGAPHDQKPDVDNLAKGFMDAFKTEDKHVYVLHAEKYWADAGAIELTEAA